VNPPSPLFSNPFGMVSPVGALLDSTHYLICSCCAPVIPLQLCRPVFPPSNPVFALFPGLVVILVVHHTLFWLCLHPPLNPFCPLSLGVVPNPSLGGQADLLCCEVSLTHPPRSSWGTFWFWDPFCNVPFGYLCYPKTVLPPSKLGNYSFQQLPFVFFF